MICHLFPLAERGPQAMKLGSPQVIAVIDIALVQFHADANAATLPVVGEVLRDLVTLANHQGPLDVGARRTGSAYGMSLRLGKGR